MLDLRDIPFCSCDHCGDDVSAVATFARFCPHCGVKLPAFQAARASAAAAPSPLERAANLILRGYANAMFRLGVHYEVRHHDEEAIRCFGKASRLGSVSAKSRLIDIPLAKKMESAPVEPSAPGTSVA